MNKNTIAELVATRYLFGHYFASLLVRLAKRLPPGNMRQIVLLNLSEELGRGIEYAGPPHWRGRKALLEALGYDYPTWRPLGGLNRLDPKLPNAVTLVIKTFRELITTGDPVVAYGAIAESESLVPSHYEWLLAQLRIHWPELPKQALWHLNDHVEHDVDHGIKMFSVAAKQEDQNKIAQGQEIARRAWHQFWIDSTGSDPAG